MAIKTKSRKIGNSLGIVKSQPFFDGNEPTRFLALYTFPKINRLHLIATEAVTPLQILALADCRLRDDKPA